MDFVSATIRGMPSKKPVPCSHRARFGRNVAAMRINADITQEQVAERSGLSSRYWQSIEAGEYFPPVATLARIKAMLDCSWEALFEGCD
ncbi:MAG: helix-turn-helix transcriptional regulator [Terrimicrobiaceae bacterium]